MTSARFTLALMIAACGKHERIGTSAFANEGDVRGTTIELMGQASGDAVTDSTCTYRVDGNTITFDVAVTRAAPSGCSSSAEGFMLKVTCTGPRLARGHYVVKEDGSADAAHLALEGDVSASGTGELTRTLVGLSR